MRHKPKVGGSGFWRLERAGGSKTRKNNKMITVDMANELEDDERDFFFNDELDDDENFETRSAKSKAISVSHQSTVSRTKRTKFAHKTARQNNEN